MSKWNYANCMGYALEIDSWLIPNNHNNGWSRLTRSIRKETILMLLNCGRLTPVKRKDMVIGKQYVVFRFSKDDFHFMRRNEYGLWRHKPGDLTVRGISEKDVFAHNWNDRYYGKIYLYELD